jgi:hypothetical protein
LQLIAKSREAQMHVVLQKLKRKELSNTIQNSLMPIGTIREDERPSIEFQNT